MKNKKIALVLCAALFIAPFHPVEASAMEYALSVPSPWAAAEVSAAIQSGIVPEDLRTNFNSTVTRGEFARLLMQSLRIYYGLSNEQLLKMFYRQTVPGKFTDTNDPDVLAANAFGITDGTSVNTFSPELPVTRAQAAVMLTRAAVLRGITPNMPPSYFLDSAEIPPYALDGVTFISSVQNNQSKVIMSGASGVFNPNGGFTREQLICTVYRLHTTDVSGLGTAEVSGGEEIAGITGGMVYVQGGTFTLGKNISHTSEQDPSSPVNDPPHEITLTDYYISSIEVTQQEFSALMGFNPSAATEFTGGSLPVFQVTWYDAAAYCNKLSEKNGLAPVYTMTNVETEGDGNIISASVSVDWDASGYRLPTEAEWVYAASGGAYSGHFTYAGSNEIEDVAWYSLNAYEMDIKGPRPVGSKMPNELGLYDMIGNVSEWCGDWYGENYYNESPAGNPLGPESGTQKIRYGGSWITVPEFCVIGIRGHIEPELSLNNLGFRVARRHDAPVTEEVIPTPAPALPVITPEPQIVYVPGKKETEIETRTVTETRTVYVEVEVEAPREPEITVDLVYVEGTGNDPVTLGMPTELFRALDPSKRATYYPSVAEGFNVTSESAVSSFEALVSSYYIGQYPVTQREFETVMGYNPSQNNGRDNENHPADKVTFYEAVEFCNRLSDMYGFERVYTIKTFDIVHKGRGNDCECDLGDDCVYNPGQPQLVEELAVADYTKDGFRLPTEIEWEYAAKGGPNRDDYIYSGSDNLDDVAWHGDYEEIFNGIITTSYAAITASTEQVGELMPNSLDIYDMTGNVNEWCVNFPGLNPNTSVHMPEYDYAGGAVSEYRFDIRHGIRGGAFQVGTSSQMDVFYKYNRSGALAINSTGFRVARSIPGEHIENMAFIQGGDFTMGTSDNSKAVLPRAIPMSNSPDRNAEDKKDDGVKVTLRGFHIGETETTQDEFEKYMGYNPSSVKNPNNPVENITWYEAAEFCNRKSEAFGFESYYDLSDGSARFDADEYEGFRLPTEAEWLFAAQGGTLSTGLYAHGVTNTRLEYPFAGSANASEVAWYAGAFLNIQPVTQSVGLKKPNELGLYDMSGNVAEWCGGWYGENYDRLRDQFDGSAPVYSPQGLGSWDEKGVMGGSYESVQDDLSLWGIPFSQAAMRNPTGSGGSDNEPMCRDSEDPDDSDSTIGFRAVFTGPRN